MATRILIVDDSPPFRSIAAELLVARGLEVFGEAGDLEQALGAVAADCPDGVLLDVNLPGADGFAVSASLASACPSARIVLTSIDVDYVPGWVLKNCAAATFLPKQELGVADLRALFSEEPPRPAQPLR